MKGYSNFNIALYFTTRCISSIHALQDLRDGFGFFEKHLECSKVYLETHRDDMDISRDKLESFKDFFNKKGIATSGAITTTLMKTSKNKPLIHETGVFGSGGTLLGKRADDQIEKGYKRSCATLCYTNKENLNKLKEVVEFTASLFDEIIIDDFFFTSCTCPTCIEEKGERSWEKFRLKLMTEISVNFVLNPAKAVNPNVKLILKFPNWYESYQEMGYNPETQAFMFDEVYTGTETRDTNHSSQHLPRYGSYSLMRWLDNLKPGHNGGGWIDQLGSMPKIEYFLEQAFLTLFAKGRELTLFCYSWLLDMVHIPALGHELGRLDNLLGYIGNPVGIPAYEPFHAFGEDHLYDYLGMAGMAFDPSPQFPDTSNLIFVSANCAKDPSITIKIKNHLLKGSDICMTSGFLKEMKGNGVEEFTSAKSTDKKVYSNEFLTNGSASSGYCWSRSAVLLPVVDYRSNSADCLVAIRKEDNCFPVLLRNGYGNGTVYTLTVPDDYAELYKYPAEVLTTIRQYLMSGLKIYLESGEKAAIFLYDNDTFILESYHEYASKVKVHVYGSERKLIDIRTGNEITAAIGGENESVFEVDLQPVLYSVFRLV